MELVVNGKTQVFEESGLNILNLLGLCEVKMPDMVSVQLNGEFVERAKFEEVTLKEKDEVEFLYFMGGGR